MLRRAALALVLASACKHEPPAADASAPPPASVVTPSATALATAAPLAVIDAGPSACRTVDGPTKLARVGPFTVVSRMGAVDFYAEDHGKPILAGSMHVDPRPGLPIANPPPVGAASTHVGKPPCAAAGTFVFCMNPEGEIRRFRSATLESDNFIARARPGTRLAAAMAGGHPIVAYLRDQMTTEGRTSEAFVESDDGTELRLSEDGAGATTVALASRGQGAVATYVDARRAMSPVHARTLTASPKLALGKDAVLFIAGSAEPATRVALGVHGGSAFVLLPVAHELNFGLALVKVEGEPQTDANVTWSDYPNGLDPAPVAASEQFVARVRPSAAKFGSPHVLELGTVASGTFVALGLVPTTGDPLDVAIEADGANGIVLAYTDSTGAYATRMSCETP
ncbi:MAG TPA: hypothetical protein VGH28_06265 [Polyangiaceae bacterium]|jgi:hypothetical protein